MLDRLGLNFQQGQKIFSFLLNSSQSHPAFYLMGNGDLLLWNKWPGHETDHSSLSGSEIKNDWWYTSTLSMPSWHAWSHFLKPVYDGQIKFQNHCATVAAVYMLNNLSPISHFIFIRYLICWLHTLTKCCPTKSHHGYYKPDCKK